MRRRINFWTKRTDENRATKVPDGGRDASSGADRTPRAADVGREEAGSMRWRRPGAGHTKASASIPPRGSISAAPHQHKRRSAPAPAPLLSGINVDPQQHQGRFAPASAPFRSSIKGVPQTNADLLRRKRRPATAQTPSRNRANAELPSNVALQANGELLHQKRRPANKRRFAAVFARLLK